ncbi:hypothetical protein ACHAWF_003128 [Thalassiosira exigua]
MKGLAMANSLERDSAPQTYSAIPLDEIVDRIAAMRLQESSSAYRCRDYIAEDDATARADAVARCGSPCSSAAPRRRRRREGRTPVIDRDSRAKMVEWSMQVSDFCKFQRETVAMSMGYVDRFLGTSSPRARRALGDKKEFQLVAMTALYISVKLFEPVAMDAGLLAEISHGCYEEEEILEMEEEILRALSWRMNGPTAHAFVEHILALLPPPAYGRDRTTASTLRDFSRFQAEIAVADYDLSLNKPSIVALAAVLNSIEGIEKKLFPARSRFQFFHLLSEATGLNPFSREVNAVRASLLELFRRNSGCEMPQVANLLPIVKPADDRVAQKKLSYRKKFGPTASSPVGVTRAFAPGTGATYCAKCA